MLTAQIEKNLFYDGRYYDLQQETGAYSGVIDLFKFAPEVRGVVGRRGRRGRPHRVRRALLRFLLFAGARAVRCSLLFSR